jgi:hypothetical protein
MSETPTTPNGMRESEATSRNHEGAAVQAAEVPGPVFTKEFAAKALGGGGKSMFLTLRTQANKRATDAAAPAAESAAVDH